MIGKSNIVSGDNRSKSLKVQKKNSTQRKNRGSFDRRIDQQNDIMVSEGGGIRKEDLSSHHPTVLRITSSYAQEHIKQRVSTTSLYHKKHKYFH
jgi:hypothetical protein